MIKLQKQPDRVYGLYRNDEMNSILSKISDATLRTAPFQSGSDSLVLFPHLVLEAKRSAAAGDFCNIQNQTALPIRALLRLQQTLLGTDGPESPPCPPLVWFVANQGQIWFASAAYIEEPSSHTPKYVGSVSLVIALFS